MAAPVPDLTQIVAGVEWSEPSTFDQTEVHHGYRRNKGHLPALYDEWGTQDLWLSWIDPGGYILPHRDAGPYRRRIQIPIRPSGYMWTEADGWTHHTSRFEVPHWGPHAVVNPGPGPRVHLVVDLPETVNDSHWPFETYGWPIGAPDDVKEILYG